MHCNPNSQPNERLSLLEADGDSSDVDGNVNFLVSSVEEEESEEPNSNGMLEKQFVTLAWLFFYTCY